MLKGREEGQVGPQRFDTIDADLVVTDVKVLDVSDVGEVGP